MPPLITCKKSALLLAVSLLGGCAGRDYVSDMYQPNFGLRVFPHFDASADPDPVGVANGLYTSRPLQGPCYLCSPSQSQFSQAGWSP